MLKRILKRLLAALNILWCPACGAWMVVDFEKRQRRYLCPACRQTWE